MAKSTRGVRPGRKHPSVLLARARSNRLWRQQLAPDLSRGGEEFDEALG